MSGDFGKYIFMIVILITAISACFYFLLHKRRNRTENTEKHCAVTGGNISVFFDRLENVTLIPYVKDKYGRGKATAKVDVVKAPYTPGRLGSAVKKCLNGCKGSIPCTNEVLLSILDTGDWKLYSQDKRNISVYFREGYGLVFNTTTRKPEGVFQFNVDGIEKTMPADAGDTLLGNTLLQLLAKCR